MKIISRVFGGIAALFAFICAVLIGVYNIASSAEYRGMVDSMLGGAAANAGTAEAYAYTSEYDSLMDMLTERVRIAEQIAEEGCVLLKNDGALPLKKSGSNVTVIGNRPYTYKSNGQLRDTRLTFYGGITGSVIYEQKVTINDGKGGKKTINSPVTLEKAFADEGINVNPLMRNFYSNKDFSPLPQGSEAADAAGGAYSINEPSVTLSDTGVDRSEYSKYRDACFVVIGRTSGEGRDYLPGKSGVTAGSSQKSAIGLSDEERNLIAVADAVSHGNVIVLINSAVAMEIDELKNDERVNSILWIGLPGSYGMNGVARVITGKASPSGHLSDTYAVSASLAPAARNFGDGDPDGQSKFSWADGNYTAANNGHYVVMAEGIYTGYYYYETRYNDSVLDAVASGRQSSNASSAIGSSDGVAWRYENEVAYSFGYGLSYTTFEQKIVENSFTYNEDDNTVSLRVEVRNTGSVAGKDVVQLYVQVPYTAYDARNGVEKSAIQLITFEKTPLLQPGAARTLTLTADIKYFATYDKTWRHDGVTGGYIIEDGDYYFAIGNGAHEALNNVLAAGLGVFEKDLYLEDGSEINYDGVYKWDIDKQKTVVDVIDAFNFDDSGVDGTYFARSESGVTVQNQMTDADYNYFNPGTVTYLSRSDWAGTYPKSYTKLATTSSMDKFLRSNASVCDFSQSGMVYANVMFGVDHTEEEDENTGEPLENTDIASYKGKPYDDESWDYLLQQITFDEAWQFAPLGGTNCEAFRSVNAPVVWQIDGPNGNVNRGYGVLAPTEGTMAVKADDPNAGYKSADMPCEPMVGATFNRDLVEEQGDIYGEDTLWSRNPIMWAPGMNLHRTAFNSRNHEYYSEDPMLTNILGTAFVRGGVRKGAILSAKHFAFNTQESYREGLCQFFDEQAGREMELRAFQGLCEDVNAYIEWSNNTLNALGLMSTFSRVGVCGANGHTGMMKNILRGEWGFKGLISTDMVSRVGFFNPQDCVMNNVTFMATSSGESFLATPEWASYNNKSLVKSCPALMNGLYENMHYYMFSIANSSALNGYSPGDVIETVMSWWQTLLIVLSIVIGVYAVVFVLSAIVFDKLRPHDRWWQTLILALVTVLLPFVGIIGVVIYMILDNDRRNSAAVTNEGAQIIYCEQCGAPLDAGSAFCDSCGAKLEPSPIDIGEPPGDAPTEESETGAEPQNGEQEKTEVDDGSRK
ncbi:MAG: glycoside hydrolase family 3 C-terminal domain-containing protein [Clostridiales bacterium]|nr:glycoside hydrolase family 3 C-terminal domain-containing protein [Clostridiales bacterium]